MDIVEFGHDFMMKFVNHPKFPYRTGQLHDNFIDDYGTNIAEDNGEISFSILSNPIVNYGRILEVAPTIKYRAVSKGRRGYVQHRNRHYLYIERISNDLIPYIEWEYGVHYVGN